LNGWRHSDRLSVMWSQDDTAVRLGGILALALHITEDVALVDDQELRLRQDLQPLVEPSFGEGLAKRGDETGGGRKQHTDALLACLEAEGDGQMILPTPGGPSSSTLSPLSRYRPDASSRITFGSMDGWILKSKASRVF
jgi:hypothetical protein